MAPGIPTQTVKRSGIRRASPAYPGTIIPERPRRSRQISSNPAPASKLMNRAQTYGRGSAPSKNANILGVEHGAQWQVDRGQLAIYNHSGDIGDGQIVIDCWERQLHPPGGVKQ